MLTFSSLETRNVIEATRRVFYFIRHGLFSSDKDMRDLIDDQPLRSDMDPANKLELPTTLIRQLNQIATAQFLDSIAQTGANLTQVQHCVLATLAAHPDVDQATLAGLIGYDRATTGKVVDKLCDKGLTTRTPRPGDRRAKIVSLTFAGHQLLRELAPYVDRAQTRVLAGLSETEANLFLALLKKATLTGNELSRAPKRVLNGA
ncbi:Salmolysin [Tritonibacter multivorans]|uniref:Salmolysin n=2 Tax=Tritonibacter multivorans TaxID=928856 RepID=A0A0P1GHV0_9RHOB|nr:Salmolysin [Tritonibacter multivorans]SFC33281.1 DNA-binding transcriptional regulator, MarR family [Tritonibacter multivorans]